LLFASAYGYVAVVEWLLKHGANTDYQDTDVSTNRVTFYYPYELDGIASIVNFISLLDENIVCYCLVMFAHFRMCVLSE
jgi:hypothetical protein